MAILPGKVQSTHEQYTIVKVTFVLFAEGNPYTIALLARNGNRLMYKSDLYVFIKHIMANDVQSTMLLKIRQFHVH